MAIDGQSLRATTQRTVTSRGCQLRPLPLLFAVVCAEAEVEGGQLDAVESEVELGPVDLGQTPVLAASHLLDQVLDGVEVGLGEVRLLADVLHELTQTGLAASSDELQEAVQSVATAHTKQK